MNSIYKTNGNVSVLKINCTNPKLTELSLLLASLVLDMSDVLCGDCKRMEERRIQCNREEYRRTILY